MQIIGEVAGYELKDIVHSRYAETNRALQALILQYPYYANILQQRFMEYSAIRLEQLDYQTMLANALISNDVYVDLTAHIQQGLLTVDRITTLDLGLDAEKLLIQVPLFENLPAHIIKQLAAMLKPKLAVPGEIIIKKGSRGNEMYFISGGVIMVNITEHYFLCGSGDFFGEISLVTLRPRTADVVAKGYCKLLTLNRRDFRKFLKINPHLRERIFFVAKHRLESDKRHK